MNLQKCSACGAYSELGRRTCESCGGAAFARTRDGSPWPKRAAMLLGVPLLAGLGIWLASVVSPIGSAPSAATKPSKEDAAFQLVVLKLKTLRASTKNPPSFELVDAILAPSGTLCVVYRGTNSFGGVVTETKAVRADLHLGSWDKECAGKSGTDYSYAKHALN